MGRRKKAEEREQDKMTARRLYDEARELRAAGDIEAAKECERAAKSFED
jgi:hypothetical protein